MAETNGLFNFSAGEAVACFAEGCKIELSYFEESFA